jgi:hypothetical protein
MKELRPFIFWDGEGVKQFICHPNGDIEPDFPTVYSAPPLVNELNMLI